MTANTLNDRIDDLCQIRDELRVIWLALGNPDVDCTPEYVTSIQEHVNAVCNRLGEICGGLIEGKEVLP